MCGAFPRQITEYVLLCAPRAPYLRVIRDTLLGVKQDGRIKLSVTPGDSEIENVWNSTSTPPSAFTAHIELPSIISLLRTTSGIAPTIVTYSAVLHLPALIFLVKTATVNKLHALCIEQTHKYMHTYKYIHIDT